MQTIRRLSKQKRELLVRCADTYETADFLKGDPSWFMHQVEGKGNQEVMAFIASCLSYGSRQVFLPRIQFLLDCSCREPYTWIKEGLFRQYIPDDSACFYRLYDNHLMVAFFSALQEMLTGHGSIRAYIQDYCTTKPGNITDETGRIEAIEAIEALCEFFAGRGVVGIVPKDTRSCCKRVCMFLRWMVRENSPVDLGIWSDFIAPRSLIIPLDTHVLQEALRLRLVTGKSASMSAALRLTAVLRQAFPDDPVRGDFALFGVGASGERKA